MSKNTKVEARTVLTDPVNFLAFGFGTGLAPFALDVKIGPAFAQWRGMLGW